MGISQAFADLNSRFVDMVNGHDAHGWAALFSDDAVLVPAGQPSVVGRKGIEEWAEVATKIWNHLEVQQGLLGRRKRCLGTRDLDGEY
jgi:ketosteroid isomerase-like protein